MKYYLTSDDTETVIRKIDRLITVQVENKFLTHLNYIIRFFYDYANEHILGKTYLNSFFIWQYNFFWGGIFYPVISCNIFNERDSTILQLKTKLNICGKLISFTILIGMMVAVIYSNIEKINNEIYFNFKIILLGLIVSILFQSVPFAAYNLTRSQTIKFIEEYLALKKISDKTKSPQKFFSSHSLPSS
jgi:hypothetical protein